MKKTLFIVITVLTYLTASGQLSVNDTSLSVPMFYATYAVQLPGGDMADRFGLNHNIGGGFKWKLRNNWIFGGEFGYIFGNNINSSESIMSNLKTQSGHIIDLAGNFASFNLSERGYFISANAGKIIPILSPNPNSGLMISLSAGFLRHKIKIDVLENTAPQLWDDYKKGYDRLTGGFGIAEFIGYMYLSESRLINLYGGFEFTQAWTTPQRDVNFDTREPDPVQNRFDLLNGFRIGWIIPIFQREPKKFYYY